jgi:hypothetical protein
MIIQVDPKFAKKLFPHFTTACAVECVKELLRIHYIKKGNKP